MSRPSKELADYQALAEASDLLFLDADAPLYVRERCRWRCNRCQRTFSKSYYAVRRCACICRSRTLRVEDYQALGETLALDWVGDQLPATTKTLTVWKSRQTGISFRAAYADLGYRKLSRRIAFYVSTGLAPGQPQTQ